MRLVYGREKATKATESELSLDADIHTFLIVTAEQEFFVSAEDF